MGAAADLFDAWADLVHGGACLGCEAPGRLWCPSCARWVEAGVPVQLGEVLPGIHGGWAGEYEGWLRALIVAHKEQAAWSLVAPLGAILGQVVRALALSGPVVLVPVPSRALTVRRRGHDPLLRMARVAALRLRTEGIDASVLPLLRLRLPVRDSVGLSAVQRRRNLVDAFALRAQARELLRRRGTGSVLLCDDVTTTGTTLSEARAALALGGIEVAGVATIAAVRGRAERHAEPTTR